MRILNDYEILESCLQRATVIVCELKETETEYFPEEVRGLCKEYKWTVNKIISNCNRILEKEPEDTYGTEVDDRIKVAKILDKYEIIKEKIDA